jgi:OOP family OmpA-OmpF porin
MKPYIALALPFLLVGVAACTDSPASGWIPRGTYQIDQLNKVTPTGSAFTQYLTADYRAFANGEKDEYDWYAQQVFAKKGLAAASGVAVPPEQLADWSVDDQAAENDLQVARGNLVAVLSTDAPIRVPQLAATAQTKFDCWIHEQHEGWETNEITECRNAFMAAMTQITQTVAVVQPAPAAMIAAPTAYVVFFDFDKSNLTLDARSIIASAAHAAKGDRHIKIKVTGYTDTVGTVQYNVKLSVRRANAVEHELIKDGLASADIDMQGKGKTDLLVQTADGVREPRNRRATIELLGQ